VSVGTDPRYGRLADRVLSAWSIPASGRVDVKRAILAQWQCEQSGGWPPTLNNPGFVTLGALHSWGLDLGAVCGRQLPTFCLARFPTPEAGADAYAGGVLRGSRYSGALAAARAGNGLRFLNLITSAGWGTRYSCCRVAYAALGGKVPAVTSGTTTSTGTLTSYPLAGAVDVLGPFLTSIGRTLTDPIRDQDVNPWLQYLQRLTLIPGGSPNSNPLVGAVYNATKALVGRPWSTIGASYLESAGKQDPFGLTAAVNGLVAGVGDVLRNVAVLGFILTLLLVGLFVLATADDRPGPRLPSVVPGL
jgi:hypothetical protein